MASCHLIDIMIEKGFIISLIVLAIHYTMQEGEIFGRLGAWFERHLPKFMWPAVFECNVCMSPYYGSVLYWVIYGLWLHVASWQEWPIVIIAAMGFNIIYNKWAPEKDD